MALAAISRERRALLVTGEESTAQVKLRAARLGGAEQVEILAETNLESVCATLERERPDVCVIDSVQTLYSARRSARRPDRSARCARPPRGCCGSARSRASRSSSSGT